MDAIEQRLRAVEQRIAELEQAGIPGRPAWGRINGVPTPPRSNGEVFPAVRELMKKYQDSTAAGMTSFVGYHRSSDIDSSRLFHWQLDNIRTDDLLGMDDARNVKVLAALAHPIRLRMMKAILERPGTAADLRERLGLTSTGQTYHALNALVNGGMVQQDEDGTFVAIGDKACGFLILLGGLYNLTEGKYDPAFAHTVVDETKTDTEG
jgi:DNA-binding transcriptional ArsR family regulator